MNNIRYLFCPQDKSQTALNKRKFQYLTGKAIVYGERSRAIHEGDKTYYEIITKQAVEGAIKGANIDALLDHNPQDKLGSTSDGTLKLTSKEDGLYVECRIPPTPLGQKATSEMLEGKMVGMSFGFTGEEYTEDSTSYPPTRTITKLKIVEVSWLTQVPAYIGTSVSIRSEINANAVKNRNLNQRYLWRKNDR